MITAAAVILAILLGGASSLRGLRDTAQSYYHHSNGKGDGLGIAYDLEQIAANTHNLLTVAGRNLPPDDERSAAVQKALSALTGAERPLAQYQSLLELQRALNALSNALERINLSDRDERYRVQCLSNIQSHAMATTSSAYNDAARRFNAERGRIPAVFLASLTGIEPLELFE